MRNGVDDLCKGADVLWIEWATRNAEAVTHDAPEIVIRGKSKLIVRIHGIEAYQGQYQAVDWNLVDHLIFVSDHIRRKIIGEGDVFEPGNYRFPDKLPIHVIPNGVDLDKWTFKKREHGYNIAFVGNFIPQKGLIYMLPYLEQLFKTDPRWHLYMIGDSRNRHIFHGREGEFFDNFLKVNHLEDRVTVEPEATDDLNLWYEDNQINYVLVPSLAESFSMVVAEAMTKGIKPLINSWWGVEDNWPEELIFKNIDDFNWIFDTPYESLKYHQLVRDRYDLNKVVQQIGEKCGV